MAMRGKTYWVLESMEIWWQDVAFWRMDIINWDWYSRLIFNSWHNLGRSLKDGKDAGREGREGRVIGLIQGEPKHGGVQAQGEVFRHKVRCGCTFQGQSSWGWGWKSGLRPLWSLTGGYRDDIWFAYEFCWICTILFFFFFKDQILHKSTFLTFSEKKQPNLATVAPRDNTWLEGEWWTFRMTAFSHSCVSRWPISLKTPSFQSSNSMFRKLLIKCITRKEKETKPL